MDLSSNNNNTAEKKQENSEVMEQKERILQAQEILEAGVHRGSLAKKVNPKMAPYIVGISSDQHTILDTVKISKLLHQAGKVAKRIAEGKGKNKSDRILFVGTSPICQNIISEQAERCGAYYINKHWPAGLLTNWSTIQKQVQKLKELIASQESGEFSTYTKKEQSNKQKEINTLLERFKGILNMSEIPDLIIFTSQKRDINALAEATRLGIPTICTVDADGDPEISPYIIPSNDDSYLSLSFILNFLVSNIIIGKSRKAILVSERKTKDKDGKRSGKSGEIDVRSAERREIVGKKKELEEKERLERRQARKEKDKNPS